MNRSRCFETERTYVAPTDDISSVPRATTFEVQMDEFGSGRHANNFRAQSFREDRSTVRTQNTVLSMPNEAAEKCKFGQKTSETNSSDFGEMAHENGRLIENNNRIN